MSMKERNQEIIARRIAGESYYSIGSAFGIRHSTARAVCLRAMHKGLLTPEQIGYSEKLAAKHLIPDEEYNARWLERLRKRSRPGPNGCIEVDGFHNADGYAMVGHRKLGEFAHRVVVILTREPIPKGFMACHRCGNHGCVNPDHIYVGTMQQNARDTVAMGRHREKQKTHCKWGHEFTPENTRVVGPRKNKRQCLTCQKIHHSKRWAGMTAEQRREKHAHWKALRLAKKAKAAEAVS